MYIIVRHRYWCSLFHFAAQENETGMYILPQPTKKNISDL